MAYIFCLLFLAKSASAEQPHVIVISLDGFPARALADPRLPMPTLRALAAAGSEASGMQPINPTVTWPNHTAMVTGVNAAVHHVVANGLLTFAADGSEPRVEPWVDKSRLVHAETLYEAAAAKGLTTAQVDWVAIYGAKGVTWAFGEKPDAEGVIARELIHDGSVTADQVAHFGEGSSPAWRDEIWTDAAVDAIKRHAPNLLLLHLLQTDTLQHRYAPLSPAAYAAYAFADSCLARVVEAVRAAHLLRSTTFFVVSDHGFASYTHTVHINEALAQEGWAHADAQTYTGAVLSKAEGGADEIFIPRAEQRAALIPRLQAYLSTLPGVSHVYAGAELSTIGMPAEADTEQAPQLYLTAAEGYAFADEPASTLVTTHEVQGTHGYLNTSPQMQALFVASGAHVRRGLHLGQITNLRVAPTIARILHIQLGTAEPSLDEMLN